MPSLFDSQDATGNTQEMDTSASQGSTKRDGVGAEEQRHRRQLRRTASRTKQKRGPILQSHFGSSGAFPFLFSSLHLMYVRLWETVDSMDG